MSQSISMYNAIEDADVGYYDKNTRANRCRALAKRRCCLQKIAR